MTQYVALGLAATAWRRYTDWLDPPAGTAPTVESVFGTLAHGNEVSVLGANFGSEQGSGKVLLVYSSLHVEQPVTSWIADRIVVTVDSDTLPFGNVTVRVLTPQGTGDLTVSHAATSGTGYLVCDVPWSVGAISLFSDVAPPVVDGDQVHYETTTDRAANVEVFADGTFVIDDDDGLHTLTWRLWDESELEWSAWFDIAVSTGDPAFVGPDIGALNLLTNTPWSLNFSSRFNDVTPGDVLTYSLDGSWPTWASINAQTGLVYGTPTEPVQYVGLRVGATDLNAVTSYTNVFTITVSVGNPPNFVGPDVPTLSLYEGIAMQEISAASLFSE
jgi:hypothetical protein